MKRIILSFIFCIFSIAIFSQKVDQPEEIPEKISIKDEQEVLDTIKLESPAQYKDLVELKKKHPKIYKRLIRNEFKRYKRLMDLRKTKPELFEKIIKIGQLERKTRDLARQYKETDSAERKAELKAELKNLLLELFELRQERYKAELMELEKQIKELSSKIKKRSENKEKIVERRLQNLLTTEEELEW